MIVQRGFKQPPSYHIERLRKAPLGYFFDVMTNGFGTMPDYASQIPADDRWRIVAYIRALQLSQNATQADVAAGQKVPSEAPKFKEPGSGASSCRCRIQKQWRIENGGTRTMSTMTTHNLDLSTPPVLNTIGQRSLVIGRCFPRHLPRACLSGVGTISSRPT